MNRTGLEKYEAILLALRQRINAFFDILELLVVRLTLLILLVLGAYTLIRGHL